MTPTDIAKIALISTLFKDIINVKSLNINKHVNDMVIGIIKKIQTAVATAAEAVTGVSQADQTIKDENAKLVRLKTTDGPERKAALQHISRAITAFESAQAKVNNLHYSMYDIMFKINYIIISKYNHNKPHSINSYMQMFITASSQINPESDKPDNVFLVCNFFNISNNGVQDVIYNTEKDYSLHFKSSTFTVHGQEKQNTDFLNHLFESFIYGMIEEKININITGIVHIKEYTFPSIKGDQQQLEAAAEPIGELMFAKYRSYPIEKIIFKNTTITGITSFLVNNSETKNLKTPKDFFDQIEKNRFPGIRLVNKVGGTRRFLRLA